MIYIILFVIIVAMLILCLFILYKRIQHKISVQDNEKLIDALMRKCGGTK